LLSANAFREWSCPQSEVPRTMQNHSPIVGYPSLGITSGLPVIQDEVRHDYLLDKSWPHGTYCLTWKQLVILSWV
jgi:hypothetical protein